MSFVVFSFYIFCFLFFVFFFFLLSCFLLLLPLCLRGLIANDGIKEKLIIQYQYSGSPHVRESRTSLDSGFHAMDSGFWVLDSGFQYSGFRIPKRAGFQFFTVLMLFFAFHFRVWILLYWKTLLECITSLFSFSIYKLWVECITVL